MSAPPSPQRAPSSTPATPAAPTPASPFAYPLFRGLWLAGVISFVGSFVQNVGEAWLMLDLTKSPLAVAMLATAFVGSSVVVMLPAGVLADRYDKRKVALASQVVQAFAALVMAALAYTGHITPSALIACVAVLGVGMALGAPAWAALLPEILPRAIVAEAVALNAVAFNLARAVGPAVGGIVLARFGATTSFLLNAASFVAVMVPLVVYRTAVHPPRAPAATPSRAGPAASERPATPAPPPPPPRIAASFTAPLARIVRDRELRSIFVAMLSFTLGAASFYALTPAFAKETLGATALSYGVMIGTMGAGAVVGSTVLKPLRARVSPTALLTGTMLVLALSALAVSRVGTIGYAMVLFVPAGVGWIGSFSSLAALGQMWAPDRERARIIALYQMAHLATWAVGSSIGGVVAERFGTRAGMSLGGFVCAVAALSTWKIRLPASFLGRPAAVDPR